MGRGKIDDTSLDYYLNNPYKGRKKGKDWELLRKAYRVLQGYKPKGWPITEQEYYKLRNLLIELRTTHDRSLIGPILSFPFKAIKKMTEDLDILLNVLDLFEQEIDKGTVAFLNIAKAVFKEDFDFFAHLRTNRGRPLSKRVLRSGETLFKKWLRESNSELPKSFYNRDKAVGLCLFALKAYRILYEPIITKANYIRKRTEVLKQCQEYGILPFEVSHYCPNPCPVYFNNLQKALKNTSRKTPEEIAALIDQILKV